MNTVEFDVHFKGASKGRKRLRSGPKPEPTKAVAPVPRVARLMALAIHFDGLIRNGVVADYADLARLGGVSRARITQVMNLLNFAPDIQEAMLDLRSSDVRFYKCSVRRYARAAGAELDWCSQRRRWKQIHERISKM